MIWMPMRKSAVMTAKLVDNTGTVTTGMPVSKNDRDACEEKCCDDSDAC